MDNYVGKMLDNRYEILEVIGVGGMAVVYKTRCHRLNRLVALKILKSEYAKNDDFRKRFHAESQAVAMLSHPNIVAVYDVSRSENVEYIVMELIDGITLKQYMQKKGSLNWREALHFATQIAKALSHAHGRGIIHRDIKPHNIMILRDGSVKVADFGIARFASKQNTLTQEALGSVHYISPEQARGSHIDARSDIYSVGVVLYEMLTGRLPYEGDSPVSVAIQHINSIPLTPREIDSGIPEALEAITMKAMSPSLGKRYSSAETLLHDLEEFRKNPSINFDYDLDDLTARDETDEPTKDCAAGSVAGASNAKGKRPRDAQEDSMYRARQRNKSLTMLSGVLTIAIFVAGMVYLAMNLKPDAGSQGDVEWIEVPNLLGKSWEKEVQNSGEYEDFIITPKAEGEYHDYYAEGEIIKQDPQPKQSIRKDNNYITVTLSKGKSNVRVPELDAKEYREAINWLNSAGFVCRDPMFEYSDEIPKDYVIKTEPAAGEMVPNGSFITVYVSRGPLVSKVKMPRVLDMMVGDAERELERYDLLWKPHIYVESTRPRDTVISQDIASSVEIDVNTEVQLEISSGPPDELPDDPDNPDNPDDPTSSPEPSVSPSPDIPASPSPSPSTQPTTITVPVSVSLPDTPGTVNIRIVRAGIIVVTKDVNTSEGVYTQYLTGSPDDLVEIFINDVLQTPRPLSYFQQ